MFRLSADNATGETRNQTVFKMMAYMVFTERFQLTEVAFQRTGHSHNRQDQRFSVANTAKKCS